MAKQTYRVHNWANYTHHTSKCESASVIASLAFFARRGNLLEIAEDCFVVQSTPRNDVFVVFAS